MIFSKTEEHKEATSTVKEEACGVVNKSEGMSNHFNAQSFEDNEHE